MNKSVFGELAILLAVASGVHLVSLSSATNRVPESLQPFRRSSCDCPLTAVSGPVRSREPDIIPIESIAPENDIEALPSAEWEQREEQEEAGAVERAMDESSREAARWSLQAVEECVPESSFDRSALLTEYARIERLASERTLTRDEVTVAREDATRRILGERDFLELERVRANREREALEEVFAGAVALITRELQLSPDQRTLLRETLTSPDLADEERAADLANELRFSYSDPRAKMLRDVFVIASSPRTDLRTYLKNLGGVEAIDSELAQRSETDLSIPPRVNPREVFEYYELRRVLSPGEFERYRAERYRFVRATPID